MPVCNTLHVCGVVVKLQYILNVVQAAQHTSDHQSKKTKIIPETVLDCGSLSRLKVKRYYGTEKPEI